MTRTILAAIDGAPSSAAVLRTAGELAGCLGARLVLFRSADVPVERSPEASEDERAFIERIRGETWHVLEAQRQAAGLQQAEVSAEVGPAWRTILEAAEELGAEVVILGAQGLGSGNGGMGSVTSRVLAGCRCSVLVVRPPPGRQASLGAAAP